MLYHETHQGPWNFMTQNTFKEAGVGMLLQFTISDWFEVYLLNQEITSAIVILLTKAYFAHYGTSFC